MDPENSEVEIVESYVFLSAKVYVNVIIIIYIYIVGGMVFGISIFMLDSEPRLQQTSIFWLRSHCNGGCAVA